MRPTLSSCHVLAALCLAGSANSFAQATPPTCATVDADQILRNSASSKAAQQRLTAEFKPQFDAMEPLTLARNQAEGRWLDAKRTGRTGDEVDPLKQDYEQAAAAERKAAAPLRQALDRRKGEELNKLIGRVNDIYKRMGTEQGFKILLQAGEKEPIHVLERGATRARCQGETDLTGAVIQQLDQDVETTP